MTPVRRASWGRASLQPAAQPGLGRCHSGLHVLGHVVEVDVVRGVQPHRFLGFPGPGEGRLGPAGGAVVVGAAEAGADILFGIGGTPEGVITAAALKCMGGEIQARLAPSSDEERQNIVDAGIDADRVLGTDDLISGENCFFACTGITDGELVRGVHYGDRVVTTSSLVMRSKSGTVRSVTARYPMDHARVL